MRERERENVDVVHVNSLGSYSSVLTLACKGQSSLTSLMEEAECK